MSIQVSYLILLACLIVGYLVLLRRSPSPVPLPVAKSSATKNNTSRKDQVFCWFICGHRGAGKTSLIYRLMQGTFASTVSTSKCTSHLFNGIKLVDVLSDSLKELTSPSYSSFRKALAVVFDISDMSKESTALDLGLLQSLSTRVDDIATAAALFVDKSGELQESSGREYLQKLRLLAVEESSEAEAASQLVSLIDRLCETPCYVYSAKRGKGIDAIERMILDEST